MPRTDTLTAKTKASIIRRLCRANSLTHLRGVVMHAVIRTGGKQYRVAEGDVVRVEKLDVEAGSVVELDEVLLISDGENVEVGKPTLDGKSVSAEVQAQDRAD